MLKYHERLNEQKNKIIKLNIELLNKNKNRYRELLIRLQSSSPLKIMTKGFASVSSQGKVVKSVEQIKLKDRLEITVVDGLMVASVIEIIKNRSIDNNG